jgi:uncharacterized protein
MRSLFKDHNPGLILLLLFSLALIGALLFMLLGGITTLCATEATSLSAALTTDYKTEQGLMGIRILQSFQTIGIFIFPSLVLAFLVSYNPWGFLGFRKISIRLILLSSLFMIVSLPGINFLASINALVPMPQWMLNMERTAMEITNALLKTHSPTLLFLNIIVVAVLPALGEELFFRGVIQPYVCKIVKNTFWGILIASAFFSAIHLQFQGFIPRLLLGMMFGYLYVWSGSIWLPIAIHFINNAAATVLYYFVGLGSLPTTIESFGEIEGQWGIGLVSILAASALAWLVKMETSKKLHGISNQSAA